MRDPAVWARVLDAWSRGRATLGLGAAGGDGLPAARARGQRRVPRCSSARAPRDGADLARGRRRGRGDAVVSRVAFVVHEGRPAAVAAADDAARRLEARGVACDPDAGRRRVDLVIAVGGDGTFLRGAHVAARARRARSLGVKVGRLGFLTEVEPERGGGADRARRSRARADRGAPRGGGGAGRRRRVRGAVGDERGHGREARPAPAGAAPGRGGRGVRHDVLGRRGHRGDADGLDRLLVLGAGADRVARRSSAWS